MENMKTAVMALKVKSDKAGAKAIIVQTAEVKDACAINNVRLIDSAVTYGGTKDLVRELKRIDDIKRFDYVILYSPAQVTKDINEYKAFVAEVEQTFKCRVRTCRTG